MENLEKDNCMPGYIPRNVNTENALEIISIIGIERVKKVYDIMAWHPVSFAALAKIIKFQEVDKALDETTSLNNIARTMQVSKQTIYRLFKKKLEQKRKQDKNILKKK